MSFQQKKKHRPILPSNMSIEDGAIFESQKTKLNKINLDFSSPKLDRLRSFIKSPVQKSRNRYKKFQDSDEENSFVEGTIVTGSPKRQPSDVPDDDISSMNVLRQQSKGKSETSLLATKTTVPTDCNTTTPIVDNPIQQHGTHKQFHIFPRKETPKTLPNKRTDSKSSNQSANLSCGTGNLSDRDYKTKSEHIATDAALYPPIVKSASSSGFVECQTLNDSTFRNENVSNDTVDVAINSTILSSGDSKNINGKWDPSLINIEVTKAILQSLDNFIKQKKDKMTKDFSQKEEMVDKLITNFSHTSDNKSSMKIRRQYENMNKSSEKSMEKTQLELEKLEYKRLVVSQEGVPWGVDGAEFVKKISKKDIKKKKNIDPVSKDCSWLDTRLLKGHTQKSASAENVSQLGNSKCNESSLLKSWFPKSASEKKNKDNAHKYLTLDGCPKSSLCNDQSSLSKSTNQFQCLQKPNSASHSSAMSWDPHSTDKNSQAKKSKSNSVSSFTGRDPVYGNADNRQDSPRNLSFSANSAEEIPRSDDLSVSRMHSLQEDIGNIKKELHDVRSECHIFQCEAVNLRLDMTTNTELNSQKMQNAIESVDRMERMLDKLKTQCQIEFCTWKSEFRSLEEKLDYRLTTTRRDLQDNIDACNNSIGQVEKRTEQLPFLSSRSGRSDVKIITDHLTNLVVSLIAFFMLLISSGLHLLIRVLNMGATISQHRNSLLLPLVLFMAVLVVAFKWPLLSRLMTSQDDSTVL